MGALVTLQPEFGFVLEDADTGRVCGYALATLDSRQHATKTDVAWLPAMRQKYPKPDKTELLTPAEVCKYVDIVKILRMHLFFDG